MPGSAQLTMVVSFDLGGSFDSAQAVIDALGGHERFGEARSDVQLRERVQASYRISHEPDVLVPERELRLALESWPGSAQERITLHSSGIATFEITAALGSGGIADCTKMEEAFYEANLVRYEPYLMKAYGHEAPEPTGDDGGLDLITPIEELRKLLRPLLQPRPEKLVYPAPDMRMVVSMVVDDLDESRTELVAEFFRARKARAQLSEAVPDGESVAGRQVENQEPAAIVRRWGCVLFASCDVDGALVVADKAEHWARPVAVSLVAMAQRMWFTARMWVGVLDQIGTVPIRSDMDAAELRKLRGKVVTLSAAEFEIQSSMATVDAAGVMLRDSWHVQLVGVALQCFEIELQRRLIDQFAGAVARNHATVAEVLDRLHQDAARKQADRLQYLFSVAVAAGIASLVLTIAELQSLHERIAVGAGTVVGLWAALAGVIWLLSRRRISLEERPRSFRKPGSRK